MPTGGPGEPAPLSSDQRRLWFINELRSGGLEYNVDAAWRMRGPVRPDALDKAVGVVVHRHDVLRTRIAVVGSEPFQVVGESEVPVLQRHDLSAEPDPVAAAGRLAARAANETFDLARGPLARFWLARLADEDHAFGVAVHHLIFDRESLTILLAELAAAYLAGCDGGPIELPALSAQFSDFARWQRRRAEAEGRDVDRRYWRGLLAEVPVVAELPTDRPRSAQPSGRAGAVAVRIPVATAERVRSLAGEHRSTPFVVGLAAFQGLLLRYASGGGGVAVGCPFNARTRVEFEPLIGFFARSLPIVADLDARADPTFEALVRLARDRMLEAHQHQELPLDEIVALAGPPRDLGFNPVFQVWFDLSGAEPATPSWPPGVELTPLATGQVRTRFDLELHLVDEGPAGIAGRLLYAADLFDEETAQDLARHYETFLAAAVAAPRTRWSRIPMLSADEEKMIMQWTVERGRSEP